MGQGELSVQVTLELRSKCSLGRGSGEEGFIRAGGSLAHGAAQLKRQARAGSYLDLHRALTAR